MSKSVAIIGTRGYPSYYGGFETAVRKLAPYLSDRDWSVTVYGREGATRHNDPGKDPRVRAVVSWGVESKSLSTLSYGLSAAWQAARERPDVALVMNVANGYWLPILRRAGVSTLVNVDGIEWERAKWGRLAKRVFRTGARLTAKYGDLLVYDSREIERRWLDQFQVGGTFIPYGGDVPTRSLPLEPGLSHRGYALLVARFVPENSIEEFLTAASTIAQRHDVVLVGSTGYGGVYDDAARELARSHTRVRWLGHVAEDDRIASLWQHAGAYFHGHSVGGTNPALVQAMACGAPIVARDTVYNREVLGDAGRFVQPRPEAIAAAVSSLLDDPESADALGRLAIARGDDEYRWSSVCARYEQALASLVMS